VCFFCFFFTTFSILLLKLVPTPTTPPAVQCPGMTAPPPPDFSTCLGDLYSVAWMEDADASDLNRETLKKQFQRVKERVSQNFTYAQGSHVMRFGDFTLMDEEPAADFLGPRNDGRHSGGRPLTAAVTVAADRIDSVGDVSEGKERKELRGAVEQREADLVPLRHAAEMAPSAAERDVARRALDAELKKRAMVDASVADAVARLAAVDGAARPLARPVGAPVVDDWNCLRGMVAAWESTCGRLDQYGMRHTGAFAGLCNAGLAPKALASVAPSVCGERVSAIARW
jgi:legumain